jgi:hypothetical protein
VEFRLKTPRFKLVAEFQKTDAKKRLSLGLAVEVSGSAYNICRNRLGQVVLDPVKPAPAHKAWIFENKPALASVKRGLKDSSAGRTKNLGTFAAHAED